MMSKTTTTLPGLRPLAEWPLAEAAGVIGAELPGAFAERRFGPISTDTRTIGAGDFFLAIKGEKFDGHEFCKTAVERGAGGLIVNRDFSSEFDAKLPVLRVPEALRAYGDIAHHQRLTWGGRVIALSGSVGKTTTRRLIAQALRAKYGVLEPTGNFNNLIGLPHTLLRLSPEHDVAVLELGMNMPGELRRLTEIAAPDVAGLTWIGRAHVGMFRSHEELIEAKLDLFAATSPGVPLVINAACENSARARNRFGASHPIVSFRADDKGEADYSIENVRRVSDPGFVFDLKTPGGTVDGFRLAHFGRHMLENVAAAAAMIGAAGYDPSLIAGAVERFETEPLRGQIVRAGEWTLILDCYNAPPESMAAGLTSLAEFPWSGRTVLVLADMLELGEHSRAVHESMLPVIRRIAPAAFFGLGPEMTRIAETLKSDGREAAGFSSADDLTEAAAKSLQSGDRVYFKGSHSFALEKVAQELAPGVEIIPKKKS